MADSEVRQAAIKILAVSNVKQIAIVEAFQLLMVLSHGSLQAYAISAILDSPHTVQMVQTIQGHCSIFGEGSSMGKHLICCVDSSIISSTVRVFELETSTVKATEDQGSGQRATQSTVGLKLFKELYLPYKTSAVFLIGSAVCLACTNGFNLVSLDNLEVKTFRHPTKPSSNLAPFWRNTKAKHVQSMNGTLLLSYSDVSLFMNTAGERTRPEWHIDWNSSPQSFSLLHPWILAFNTKSVEFRNIEEDASHVLARNKIRMLHGNGSKVTIKNCFRIAALMLMTCQIFFSYTDNHGEEVIATLSLVKA